MIKKFLNVRLIKNTLVKFKSLVILNQKKNLKQKQDLRLIRKINASCEGSFLNMHKPYKGNQEKAAKAFYDLCDMFFDRNYGLATKSEIELLLFYHFMESLRESREIISDYNLSKQLGITQQRVRNLRVRENLIYPQTIDINKEFVKLIPKADYNKVKEKITIDIEDPNLHIELQNLLQTEHNAYIETKLNSRLLVINPKFLFNLIATSSDNEKEIVKELKNKISTSDKAISKLEGKNFWKKFNDSISTTNDLVELIKILSISLPPAISSLMTLIK